MVLKPGSEDQARAIFDKWQLDFAVVGSLTDTGRMVIMHHGEMVANLPIDPLALASPEYDERDRPWTRTPKRPQINAERIPAPNDPVAALTKLMGTPDMSSKRWIWEQYDHMVMADTMGKGRPGGDAALVRIHGTNKALAIATDCTPRYCQADPVEGGRHAVAEVWRNITATGAQPLAITDCMNFGNPERPEIMGQFVGAINGMREACLALEFPVVSGNVSLYNETNGEAILPTPAIGGVGLIDDSSKAVGIGITTEGLTILLIGETGGHLGQSMYLREIEGREDGAPPPVDLSAERLNGDFVRGQINAGSVVACHDLSDGGLAAAVAEMAMASRVGVTLDKEAAGKISLHAWLFGEDQARYLIATTSPEDVLSAASDAGVPATAIGISGGHSFSVAGFSRSLTEIRNAHESWMPAFMGTV